VACAISVASLNGIGIPSARYGTAIYCGDPGQSLALDIADACSGLRSLLAMLALASIYAYLTQKTTLKKALLFAASVPIAVAANVFRIVAIAVVGHWFGHERAMKVYHDYSGFLVFAAAVVLLVSAGDLIARFGSKKRSGLDENAGFAGPPS
jgi:exosortase